MAHVDQGEGVLVERVLRVFPVGRAQVRRVIVAAQVADDVGLEDVGGGQVNEFRLLFWLRFSPWVLEVVATGQESEAAVARAEAVELSSGT